MDARTGNEQVSALIGGSGNARTTATPETPSVTGRFSLDGASHPVTVATTERRDGQLLQVAGSAPVSLATWGTGIPAGLGPLGSLDNHGVAEFVLQLHPLGSLSRGASRG